MAAKTNRKTAHHHLEATAQGIACVPGLVDGGDHALSGRRIEGSDRREIRSRIEICGEEIRRRGLDIADAGHVAADRCARHPLQKHLGQSSRGHPRRRLARRRPFQYVAGIAPIVLENPRQIRMARPRQIDRLERLRVPLRVGKGVRHGRRPILPVAIVNQERQRRAQGDAKPDAGEDFGAVGLDLHAPSATISPLAARQIGIDIGSRIQRNPRREALDDGHEATAMGFAGRMK